MHYNEALSMLDNKHGDKNRKKLENNTYLVRHEDYIGVLLHDTEVVKFYPNYVILTSGGWKTATTKDRINSYAPTYLTQRMSLWYIRGGELFYDEMKLDYQGNIIRKVLKTDKKVKEVADLKKRIKTFVKNAGERFEKGMPLPDGGDCWFCAFTSEDGKTMGDLSDKDSHLLNHMKDRYYVPSLLANAVKEAGYGHPGYILGGDLETRKMGGKYGHREAVERALTKYMQKRLIQY